MPLNPPRPFRRTALADSARLPGDRFVPLVMQGLLWAFRFQPGYPPEPIEPDDVSEALAGSDGWVWLHFSLTDKLARSFLESLSVLPEPARELLVGPDERLGLETAEGTLFGVLADFEHELDRVTADLGRLRFAATARLVVSGRRHPLRSVEDIHRKLGAGAEIVDRPGQLVEAIVDQFCDGVARLAADMANQLDDIEDSIVSGKVEAERAKLIPLRRTAVRLHRQLASLAAILRDWAERSEDDSALAPAIEAARMRRPPVIAASSGIIASIW
jgi:zinc transporter